MRDLVALIFGVTGQDGSYLAEHLLQQGYMVIGVKRRCSTCNTHNLKNMDKLIIEEGDITDSTSVNNIISKYMPDHIYNLAAQSHVHTSFDQPISTFNVNTLGVFNILEAIKKVSPHSRFVQASTSEMFGNNYEVINGQKVQTENTPFSPVSPYAVSKVAAHNMVDMYRNAYGLYTCCAIMFNHESPRRGENFVTRKITKWIGKYCRDQHIEKLQLGNLKARRDWSHAADFMDGLRRMLLQDHPDNYLFCSGISHSIEDFLDVAFSEVNLDWGDHVEINSKFYRPIDVEYLQGMSSKAREVLDWQPKYTFENLVKSMVTSDLEKV